MVVKKENKSIDKAQWTYLGKKEFEIPPTAIGFVYLIKVKGTKLYYFGKKNLTSTRGRGKKAITKESTWRNYESSSKELKELIKNGAVIEKEILQFAYSKSELTLLETQQIICNSCLTDENSLNRWVSCKIFQRYLIK